MLRPSEQRLLEIARRIGYGALQAIEVRDGELIIGRTVRTRRRHRLGKADAGGSAGVADWDFKLRAQHMEFIERIRRIKQGLVTLEIQDGLPIDLIVEEDVGL